MARGRRIKGGLLAAAALFAVAATSPSPVTDLSRPFATRSPWRVAVTQGPDVKDPGDNDAPGALRLCLQAGPNEVCDPALKTTLRQGVADDYFDQPHYLGGLRVHRLKDGQPLLVVDTSSLHSGDGDQVRLTQALAYRRRNDRFVRVYEHQTGRNNNQETRFVAAGPLQGDIISIDPTENAPFGFWVVVNAPGPEGAYSQVLRYRSATRYGDNNPMSAIDSEWPNLYRRLGLWRPGAPLPLPQRACPKPRLAHMELWCG